MAMGLSVTVCVFVCLCVDVSITILRTGHTSAKIKSVKNDFCTFLHLPSNGVNAKIVLRDVDLLFKGHKFKISISLRRWEMAQIPVRIICRFLHLLPNGVNAKIVLRDLDLLVEGNKFNIFLNNAIVEIVLHDVWPSFWRSAISITIFWRSHMMIIGDRSGTVHHGHQIVGLTVTYFILLYLFYFNFSSHDTWLPKM